MCGVGFPRIRGLGQTGLPQPFRQAAFASGCGVLLASLLLAASPLHAAEYYSLTVRLVREPGDTAVSGVRVEAGKYTALSDHNGVARFSLMEEPPSSLVVRDLDYYFMEMGMNAPASAPTDPLQLRLKPIELGELTAKVHVADSEEPVVGAQVELVRTRGDYAPVRAVGFTGFDGTLRASGLPAGPYQTRVTAPAFQDCAVDLQVGSKPVTAAFPLKPLLARGAAVGTVVDAWSGKPVADAEISVVHTSQGEAVKRTPAVRSAPDGSFAIGDLPVGARQGGKADAVRPVTRRFLLRGAKEGYLDAFVPVEIDSAGKCRAQVAMWPRMDVLAEQEPNNTIETAQPIPPTTTLRLAIGTQGDRDFFRITLLTDGIIHIEVPKISIPLHLAVYEGLRNTQLVWRNFQANVADTWDVCVRAGIYVLHVEHVGNVAPSPGQFTLPVEFRPAADSSERNDVPATAALVAPGERFTGFVLPPDDRDYFRFTAALPGTGLFVVQALPIATYVSAAKSDGTGQVWRSVERNVENRVEFAIDSPGAYYLETESNGRTAQSLTPYEARLEVVPGDESERGQRNETPATATTIETDGYLCGTLNPIRDRDWYRVTLTKSGTLQARLSPLPIPTYLQIADAAGHTLAWRNAEPNTANEVSVRIPRRGIYTVEAEHVGRSAWSASPYCLRTSFYPNDLRDRRDNGDLASATPASLATTIPGQIGFLGDRDFYRIFLPRRGVLRPMVSACPIPLYIQALSPDRQSLVWRQTETGQQLSVDAQIAMPGWQTIHIESIGNTAWARAPYLLSFENWVEDPYENNDQLGDAAVLPGRTSLSASLLPLGDRDHYRFYADRKDRYRLNVTGVDVPLHTKILGPAGNEIQWANAKPGDNLTMEWDPPAPGIHWVEVEVVGRNGWSAQHYSVHIDRVGEPVPPVARMEAKREPPTPRTFAFTPSTKAGGEAKLYEIDFENDGRFDWRSERPEIVRHTYDRAAWVTAVLRVTGESGTIGWDYATFSTREPLDDRGLQLEFLRPQADDSLEGEFDVELLAWRADGGPIPQIRLEIDKTTVARWLTEPYRSRLKPDSWSGRSVTLAAIAEGDPGGRAELSAKIPALVNILPPPDALLTSPKTVFEWDTQSEMPSEVRVQGADGQQKSFTGPPGTHHRVEAPDLERDREYTWTARSGEHESRPRKLRLVRGIEFVERTFSFNINRDYDQRGTVRVVNHNETPETLRLHIENERGGLLTSFVGEGSPDRVVELAPGEFRDVLLAFAAQDAMQEHYAMPIRLAGAAAEGREVHTDVARVEVNVHMPRVEFTAQPGRQDSGTLAIEIEVSNNGDKLTDFAAGLNEAGQSRAYVAPTTDHATLDPGQRIRFQVIPVLSESFQSLDCELVMRAVHVEKLLPLHFALPAGKRVFLATVDARQSSAVNDSYCTNRPEVTVGVTVPPGAQRGGRVPFERPLSAGTSSQDIELFYRRMQEMIKRRRLNPKHEKLMQAILDKHIRQENGEWTGDPKAALAELVELLRASNFSELSRLERFLAETAARGRLRNGIDTAADLLRDPASVDSSLLTVVADHADRLTRQDSKAYQNAVDEFADKIAAMRKYMNVEDVAEMPMQRERMQAALESSKRLLATARRLFPNDSSLAEKLLQSQAQLQTQLGRLDEAMSAITRYTEKFQKYLQSLGDAKMVEKWSKRFQKATIIIGAISRYEALSRREGYSEAEVIAATLAQTAIYNVITTIPVVAAADLVCGFGTTVLEELGVPDMPEITIGGLTIGGGGVGQINLEKLVDVWVEMATYTIKGAVTDDAKAAAGVSMQRINDLLARINERLSQPGLSPEERQHLEQLRSRLQAMQTAKENDP
jgi:hypothetical protein